MAEPIEQDDFIQSLAESIRRHGLLPRGAGVVAAVSGGVDSIAMLAAMHCLSQRDQFAWGITVAHLNHLLRADAGEDEAFVSELAARLGLPVITERIDVSAEAARRGLGFEQTARELRYDFLRTAAVKAGTTHVAIAHHRDDNVETILHRIIRGTHLRGLSGMPASRPLDVAMTRGGNGRRGDQDARDTCDQDARVTLIRPLLDFSRDEIESFCRRRGLSWRRLHQRRYLLQPQLHSPRTAAAAERESELPGRRGVAAACQRSGRRRSNISAKSRPMCWRRPLPGEAVGRLALHAAAIEPSIR